MSDIPSAPPPSPHPSDNRRLIAIVAGVAAAVLLVALLLYARSDGAKVSTATSTTVSTSTTAAPTSSTTTSTTTSTPTSTTTTTTAPGFAYQMMWPFFSEADAEAWQDSYRSGGHQPWHLDANETALSFTNGFLHFTEIDRVVTSTTDSKGAHVAVGYLNPNDEPVTAAVIHLVKVGAGDDAPWEVVGTDDTAEFTFTQPAYGATVTSPVTVGGRITGVDENIVVRAYQNGTDTAIGSTSGLPAGGEDSLWTTSIDVTPTGSSVVTLVASTGGHVQAVERFAVTAVTF